MLTWSINVVEGMPEISDILVSTDDIAIANVARDSGALVPWLRPEELASDVASSVDTALHALDWYESEKGKVDGLLLLQPTSPFRTPETVRRGIDLYRTHKYRSVVGVSPTASHPMWYFHIEGKKMTPFIEGGGVNLRSQKIPPAYMVNGAFYLISPAGLRENRAFIGEETLPLVIDQPCECIDIDTELDWQRAEAFIAREDK